VIIHNFVRDSSMSPQDPFLLPQPTSFTLTEGVWVRRHRGRDSVGLRLGISFPDGDALTAQAELLAGYLREETHFEVETGRTEGGDIHLELSLTPRPLTPKLEEAGFSDEYHRISVTPEQIRIEAATPAGIARGIQSLRQLLSGQRARLSIPGMIIEDAPEFGWRGLLLDVSRHFRDAADVRRFIDLAAYHKFNLFHWHLTDDQGWRLPVDGYPLLTEIAAWRDGTLVGHESDQAKNPTDGHRHGGAYTAAEIHDIVAYAAARGIHILPEVDVPGHVQALVAAYPEFGNVAQPPDVWQHWGISSHTLNLEPETFAFLEKVVSTVTEFFPFHYLHFGGDETLTGEWEASARIQERKRELGLKSDREVQNYFTGRLRALTKTSGRAMIGWDEIVEYDQPPADTAVMFWRDQKAYWNDQKTDLQLDQRALRAGNGLVLASSSYTYFDFYQQAGEEGSYEPIANGGYLPLEKSYGWRPMEKIPDDLQDGVLGAQAQLWTEYIPTRWHLDYMTYPRACALAQVLWTGDEREDWESFSLRLDAHLQRLDRLGVAFRPRGPLP